MKKRPRTDVWIFGLSMLCGLSFGMWMESAWAGVFMFFLCLYVGMLADEFFPRE